MALKDAFTKLGDAVADLSSLDVQSFSGTLTAKIQSKNDGNILDWKALHTRKPCVWARKFARICSTCLPTGCATGCSGWVT